MTDKRSPCTSESVRNRFTFEKVWVVGSSESTFISRMREKYLSMRETSRLNVSASASERESWARDDVVYSSLVSIMLTIIVMPMEKSSARVGLRSKTG